MRNAGAVFFACMLTVCAGSARAIDQMAMPAFAVVSPAGTSVGSSQLSHEPRWLLIYVSAGCRSCDRLVAALTEWQRTLPANRMVLVIRGAPDAAQKFAEQHRIKETLGIPWYADADQSGSRALGLPQVPALVAVENGRIAWVVAGVLNDPAAVEPIVRNWTAR